MFDIGFIDNEPPYIDEEGWSGLWGRTVLGDFEERFVAPVEWWQRADYERQWIDGAKRILLGERETAFALEAGRLWWTAWREGDDVLIHQRYLVGDEMRTAWTADADHVPYELVGPRVTESEEGGPVSEWRVGIDDLQDFVARRSNIYIPG